MRNLEERMNEIRRRSEICIAKRKKRQKMLVSLVSSGLCVCLCLSAVFLLGKNRAGEDKFTGEIGTDAALDMDGVPAGNATQAAPEQIPDGVVDQENSNAPEDNGYDPLYGVSALRGVEVVYGEVASYTVEPEILTQTEAMLSGLQFECRVLGGSGMADESETADCTFTLVYMDGSRTAYRLAGSCLENAETGDFVHLSQEQLTQLRTLLGIE